MSSQLRIPSNLRQSPSTTVVFMALVVGLVAHARLDAAKPNDSVEIMATTTVSSDLQILGVWIDTDGDGTKENDGSFTASGGADSSNVIINRPSPAVSMDFLADGDPTVATPSPFQRSTTYSTDGGGTIAIQKHRRNWVLRYFFRGPGLDGSTVHYRLDGDVTISGGDEATFPTGTDVYTVTASNLRVSVDTGKKGNGYAGTFPGSTAVIRISQ